jgi:hypothetical protein
VPQIAWRGEVTNRFPNCGLTRVFGFTFDQNGGLAGDVWIHGWWEGDAGIWAKSEWTAFGTGTSWQGDEGNWDWVINWYPQAGTWNVCVVPNAGSTNCISDRISVVTDTDCRSGTQVYRITFRRN